MLQSKRSQCPSRSRVQQAAVRIYGEPDELVVSPPGRLYKLLDAIPMLFITYMDLKMFVFLILQGRHIKLQASHRALLLSAPLAGQSLDQSTISDGLNSQLVDQLRDHRLLMRQAGVALRDLGAAAMLGYATLFIAMLTFLLSDFITLGYVSNIYERDDFFVTYRNRQSYKKKLIEAYDGYLRRMIKLNANKIKTLAKGGNMLMFNPDLANEMKFGLTDQRLYLRKLVLDKGSIIPPNLEEGWILILRKFATQALMISLIILYTNCVIIATVAAYFANGILEQKGETPMSFADILSTMEIYFTIDLTLKMALPQLIWLFVNLKDKSLQLEFIKQKFERLKARFIELKQTKYLFEQESLPIGLHRRSMLARQLQQLKLDCDHEALEVYLSLRVFIDLLKSTIPVANLLVNVSCIETGFFVVIALIFSTNSETYQLIITIAIGLFLLTTVNMVLVVCARFSSMCAKTTYEAWSLVANFNDDHIIIVEDSDYDDESRLNLKDEKANAMISLKMKYLFHLRSQRIPTVVMASSGHQLTLERVCGNHIGTDTEILWRRFVADMPTLHKNFSCKVFGLITLNYKEMVHLNFSFLSVILIFLTQKWQN